MTDTRSTISMEAQKAEVENAKQRDSTRATDAREFVSAVGREVGKNKKGILMVHEPVKQWSTIVWKH